MLVVSDSSALMHLAAMDRLAVLRELFCEVHVPEEVYDEVVVRGAGKPGSAEVAAAHWIKRHTVAGTLAVLMLGDELQRGEAECILLAIELGADVVILDDRAARIRAEARGLHVTGAVGVLLLADERGLLGFPEALTALMATGFRLDTAQYQRAMDKWRVRQTPLP